MRAMRWEDDEMRANMSSSTYKVAHRWLSAERRPRSFPLLVHRSSNKTRSVLESTSWVITWKAKFTCLLQLLKREEDVSYSKILEAFLYVYLRMNYRENENSPNTLLSLNDLGAPELVWFFQSCLKNEICVMFARKIRFCSTHCSHFIRRDSSEDNRVRVIAC